MFGKIANRAKEVFGSGFKVILIFSLILISILTPFGVTKVHAAVQATYYIATNGSDSNPGTLSQPFATIQKARDVVRTINSNMTGDIIVYIEQGTYNITSTVVFDDRDSGTNGYKIYYKNYNAVGSADFNGGQAVTGWTQYSGNIYMANVGTSWTFDELFENGVRAVKARTPNVNSDYGVTTTCQGPWLKNVTYDDNSKRTFKYNAGDLNPTGWDLSGMTVDLFAGGYYNWNANLISISSVDSLNRLITLSQDAAYGLAQGGRYFIQGDLSLLDQAGEYYLNKSTGYLYYYPRSTPIENQTIIAPKVKDLFEVMGRSETQIVKNISFEGLMFECTDYVDKEPPTGGLYSISNALINMRNTQYITIKNCHLRNAGYSGISMKYYNENNTIYGNWIENIGDMGIYIWGYAPNETGRSDCNRDHIIQNNKIVNVGMHVTQGFGIVVEQSGHNDISFNYIANGPRALILGGCPWDTPEADEYFVNNKFTYNDVYKGCEDSADVGSVYFWGNVYPSGSNTIDQLRVYTAQWNANSGLSAAQPIPVGNQVVWGLYTDSQSDYWNISNVYLYDIQANPPYIFLTSDHLTATNCSWQAGFNESLMDYKNIGLKADFPPEYGNDGYTWINDTDGGWTYGGGTWSYVNTTVPKSYNSDEHYIDTVGYYAQHTFTGTEVKWVGTTGTERGKADVYIDGVFDATVDMYNSTYEYQKVVYYKTGLRDGQHTIKIVVRSDKNPNSGGNYVIVDAIGSATTYVNDNCFTYSGTWDYDKTTVPNSYNSDEHYTNVAGNYAQYTFKGTEVKWIGTTGNNRGKADVYIDGVYDATVDMYDTVYNYQKVLYYKRGLSENQHTIRIVVRNDKNASSGGYYIIVDAIAYKPYLPATYVNDISFTYSGTWNYDNATVPNSYNNDEHYVNIAGDYAQYTFTGTEVKWLSSTMLNRGKADVYIDDVLDATVDTYSSTNVYQNTVYSRTGLSNGSHTIKIVVRNDRLPAYNYIIIDALEYK